MSTGNTRSKSMPAPQCDTCGGLGYVTKPVQEHAHARPCECITDCALCEGKGHVFQKTEEGYTLSVQCHCSELTGRILRYNRSGIPARYASASIENFEEREESLIAIKYEFLKYRSTFEPGAPGILLSGLPGTGKTHLMTAFLAHLTLERGIACRFIDFGNLTQRIKRGYNEGKSENEIIDDLVAIDVLGIDELGKGRATEWEISVLDALVNRRYNAGVSTFFTTNYPLRRGADAGTEKPGTVRDPFNPEQVEQLKRRVAQPILAERVGSRIYSRLAEMCRVRILDAEDYRQILAARSQA
jgi:DNA replication protein DnaC